MRAGVVAEVNGDFDGIGSFVTTSSAEDGSELKQCVEVQQTLELPDGGKLLKGRAGKEELQLQESAQIEGEQVIKSENPEIITKYTNFLVVPGKVVISDSNAGSFVFDLIGQHTETHIESAELDLRAYLEEHEEAIPWQTGFYQNTGRAKKGVVYGNKVTDDGEVGRVLADSNLNQLGLTHPYNGHEVKITMAESGYVEVYQPNSYEEAEFAQFVLDQIAPYIQEEST